MLTIMISHQLVIFITSDKKGTDTEMTILNCNIYNSLFLKDGSKVDST